MAKSAAKSKIEIVEVQTPKVDNTIRLDEVVEQLAKKAGEQTSKGTRRGPAGAASLGGGKQDRVARIQALSAELAQELRALQASPAAGAKAPGATRKRK